MARAIWKGSISFGLVNIPVGLYAAESRDDISFKMLDRKTMSPIHYKRVSEESGKEVPWEETVRGYPLEGGRYVVLSDEDLGPPPRRRRRSTSPTSSISRRSARSTSTALLSGARQERREGLRPAARDAAPHRQGRDRQGGDPHPPVPRRRGRPRRRDDAGADALRSRVRSADDLGIPHGKQGVTDREIDMAERLVEGMVAAWEPEKYKDTYRNDVMKMIEKRAKAGELEAPSEPAPKPEKPRNDVIDLMALLKQSVEQGGKAAPGRRPRPRKPRQQGGREKAPAEDGQRRSGRALEPGVRGLRPHPRYPLPGEEREGLTGAAPQIVPLLL